MALQEDLKSREIEVLRLMAIRHLICAEMRLAS